MIRMTATLIAVCVATAAAIPAAAQSVTVVRGANAEDSKRAATGGVEVLRGTPVVAKPSPSPRRSYSRPARYQPFAAAGSTLWLRDTRRGRLVACQVWGSGYVGRDEIRCTSTY